MRRKSRVLFIGSAYAGHRTRFMNLVEHMERERRFESEFVAVTGWREHGWFERLPGIPGGVKGRVRSLWQGRAFARMPRPDIIWTSAWDVAPYYLWTQMARWRTPIVLDTDASFAQLNAMAPYYKGRPPLAGRRLAARLWLERQLLERTTVATPWSRWAAEGLEAAGVPASRIRVIPPGVDLTSWEFEPRRGPEPGQPLRLLFVGGDFWRKGGDILLELVAGPLAGRVVLDVVTRDPVDPPPGVTVHRLEANTARLRALYREANVFVLPTRAECFGIACVEALATGLPVIMTDVGGARDIVEPGVNGWLVRPGGVALRELLDGLCDGEADWQGMSAAARLRAARDFDGKQRLDELSDLLSEVAAGAFDSR